MSQSARCLGSVAPFAMFNKTSDGDIFAAE